MTILVVAPPVSWSVADVYEGVVYGLRANGVDVRTADRGSAVSLARGCDLVLVVSGVEMRPTYLHSLKAAGVSIGLILTESPYDAQELELAASVNVCWTHERTALADVSARCTSAWYLPHAWHPMRHYPGNSSAVAHDVVFVGSGFPERVTWFNAIDWTGIDLGLYGVWDGFGLKESLEPAIKSTGPIPNTQAADLYRNAAIGLNLYRWPRGVEHTGDSLNPRAYELAACGTPILSQRRGENAEIFGDAVREFESPWDAEEQIRRLLREGRTYSARLASLVAHDSWIDRGRLLTRQLHEAIGVAA